MGQTLGKASFSGASKPFVNLSGLSVRKLWQSFQVGVSRVDNDLLHATAAHGREELRCLAVDSGAHADPSNLEAARAHQLDIEDRDSMNPLEGEVLTGRCRSILLTKVARASRPSMMSFLSVSRQVKRASAAASMSWMDTSAEIVDIMAVHSCRFTPHPSALSCVFQLGLVGSRGASGGNRVRRVW